jgi:hypothetical protein
MLSSSLKFFKIKVLRALCYTLSVLQFLFGWSEWWLVYTPIPESFFTPHPQSSKWNQRLWHSRALSCLPRSNIDLPQHQQMSELVSKLSRTPFWASSLWSYSLSTRVAYPLNWAYHSGLGLKWLWGACQGWEWPFPEVLEGSQDWWWHSELVRIV